MKNLAWLIALIILAAGGSYYFSSRASAPFDDAQGPATTAGINGSPNQGNLGEADTGAPQQPSQPQEPEKQPILAWTPEPGADGNIEPVVGKNLVLGLDGTGTSSHLIGFNGKAVYTYDKDTGSKSTCTGTCATNWPPYVVSPVDIINQTQSGIDDTKVGTTTVPAGYKDPTGFTIQLTYNGKPLYFFAGDKHSSDITGDGKNGVWHIVTP